MIRIAFALLVSLALMPALLARDKTETPTPAQQYQALVKEYETAQRDFQEAVQKAKTQEERQKVFQEKSPRTDQFAARFLRLAEKKPKDPAAVDALTWIVTNVRTIKSDPRSPRTKALRILLRDHVQSEKMASLCPALANASDNDSEYLLRAVLNKSKYRPAQAQACLALARQADNFLGLVQQAKDQPALAKSYATTFGKKFTDALAKSGQDKLSKKAEALYERVIKDFADVDDPNGESLGEFAKDQLDALHHPIVVGELAPEITGKDIDGKKFKLSDYRGKVVLLDFWGNW